MGKVTVSTLNALLSFVVLHIQHVRTVVGFVHHLSSRNNIFQFEPVESCKQDFCRTALLEGDSSETQSSWQYSSLTCFLSAPCSALFTFTRTSQPKNYCFTLISLIMRVARRAGPAVCWGSGNLHVQRANTFKSQLPASIYSVSHWHM